MKKTAARPSTREAVSYMLTEPEHALISLAAAYARLVRSGRSELAPAAEVLAALADAAESDLTVSGGPREWARRHVAVKTRHRAKKSVGNVAFVAPVAPLPKSAKADAAALVGLLTPLHARGAAARGIASVGYMHLMHAEHLWGRPAGTVVEIEKRMTREIERVLRRVTATPRAVATACLVGWGVARKRANNAL